MTKGITIDLSKAQLPARIFYDYQVKVTSIHQELVAKKKDYLGWLNWPQKIPSQTIDRINQDSAKIQAQAEVLVVCGIGGSFLGAQAGLTMLQNAFARLNANKTSVIFAGNTLSGTYHQELLEFLQGKNFAICVISKSGTTLETMLAFRLLKKALIERYGIEEALKRIYVITDATKGDLRRFAKQYHLKTTYELPQDIGGRYSVLTPVGLLPLAVGGIDVLKIIEGAKAAHTACYSGELTDISCYQYAICRDYWYRQGKVLEIFASYEPYLQDFGDWLVQLFAESEGKNGKGLFPVTTQFTRDLHSLGQYIQQGKQTFFETILHIDQMHKDIILPFDNDNCGQLNYLTDKNLNTVNAQACAGVTEAHASASIPQIIIQLHSLDAWHCGYLFYWFMRACAMSASLLGVNPFNQPGVEAYKTAVQNRLHSL